MYVEDEENARNSFTSYFKRKKYAVYSYGTPEEALEALKDIKPQVIISDQKLGADILGWEFLEKSIEFSPRSVRFILTGYSDMEMAVSSFMKAQIYGYISKNSSSAEIETRVIEACDYWDFIHQKNTSGDANKNDFIMNISGLSKSESEALKNDIDKKEEEIQRLMNEIADLKKQNSSKNT